MREKYWQSKFGLYDLQHPDHPANNAKPWSDTNNSEQPCEKCKASTAAEAPARSAIAEENEAFFQALMRRRGAMRRLYESDVDAVKNAHLWELTFGRSQQR